MNIVIPLLKLSQIVRLRLYQRHIFILNKVKYFSSNMTRLVLFCVLFVAIAYVAAVDVVSARPKKCAVGTTYTKDCNTCTCGASVSADKCSQFDCSRAKASTTPRTPSQTRPGVCPTKVTPRPGIDDCSNRNQSSVCKVDKDCPGAKKCCESGCKVFQCRNAIYLNTP